MVSDAGTVATGLAGLRMLHGLYVGLYRDSGSTGGMSNAVTESPGDRAGRRSASCDFAVVESFHFFFPSARPRSAQCAAAARTSTGFELAVTVTGRDGA